MKYVIIYTLTDEAEKQESARCELVGTVAVCSGNTAIVKNLNTLGVFDKKTHESVFPKDGERFLHALINTMNSPYLFASEIREN